MKEVTTDPSTRLAPSGSRLEIAMDPALTFSKRPLRGPGWLNQASQRKSERRSDHEY